jgi:hypothetical protein
MFDHSRLNGSQGSFSRAPFCANGREGCRPSAFGRDVQKSDMRLRAEDGREANVRSCSNDARRRTGCIFTPLRILRLAQLARGQRSKRHFESLGAHAGHGIEEHDYREQPGSDQIGSPRSSSDWYSAAVCANDDRALIDENGNRSRGTPDQAGRRIPASTAGSSWADVSALCHRISVPLHGSDRNPCHFHAVAVHPIGRDPTNPSACAWPNCRSGRITICRFYATFRP